MNDRLFVPGNNGIIYIAAFVGFLFLVVVRTYVPFPLANDQAVFLIASHSLAETGHMANVYLSEGFNKAWNWHGFLQVWLIGTIGPHLLSGWKGVYLACNLIAYASFLFILGMEKQFNLKEWQVVAVSSIALALLLDARARPETLALAECLGLLSLLYKPYSQDRMLSWRKMFVAGVLLAVTLVTSPRAFLGCVASMGLFEVYGFLRCFGSRSGRTVGWIILMLGLSLGIVGLSWLCLDISLLDWFRGIIEVTKKVAARVDNGGAVKYFIMNRFLPFYGVAFFLFPLALWKLCASLKPPVSPGTLCFLMGAILLVGSFLYKGSMYTPATYYNFTNFLLPLLFISLKSAPQTRTPILSLLSFLAISASLGIGGWCAQAVAEANLYYDTRQVLDERLDKDVRSGLRVCADPPALAAVEDPTILNAVVVRIPMFVGDNDYLPDACDVYFRMQAFDASVVPPAFGNFKLDGSYLRTSWFGKYGLKAMHFGFNRYIRVKA